MVLSLSLSDGSWNVANLITALLLAGSTAFTLVPWTSFFLTTLYLEPDELGAFLPEDSQAWYIYVSEGLAGGLLLSTCFFMIGAKAWGGSELDKTLRRASVYQGIVATLVYTVATISFAMVELAPYVGVIDVTDADAPTPYENAAGAVPSNPYWLLYQQRTGVFFVLTTIIFATGLHACCTAIFFNKHRGGPALPARDEAGNNGFTGQKATTNKRMQAGKATNRVALNVANSFFDK